MRDWLRPLGPGPARGAYLKAAGLVLLAAIPTAAMLTFTPLETASALFMLPGLVAAVRYGTGPAILAALLGAMISALFYDPVLSVLVVTPSQIIDLAISLIVAITIGRLAGQLRAEMVRVREGERRVRRLYELGSEIAGAGDLPAIYDIVARHMGEELGRAVVLFAPNEAGAWGPVRADADAVVPGLAAEVEAFAARAPHDGGTEIDLVAPPGAGRWLLCRLGAASRHGAVLAVAMEDGAAGATGEVLVQARSILEEGARSLERLGLSRALEERQLRRRSDLLRDMLMGAVSHDLRTPVASIMGAASVISGAPALAAEPELVALAEAIALEARRLDRRIQNLLDVTRIRAGALQPRLEDIEATDIVNAVLAGLSERLLDRRVALTLADAHPWVRVDPVLIEQALVNILDNAAKYAPAGAPVAIALGRSGDRLAIDVRDEGPGLDGGEQAHLFERFYRGERHADIAGGSGLGLTIARTFVEACGGTIEALSGGPGQGTTMRILLPVSPAGATREDEDG